MSDPRKTALVTGASRGIGAGIAQRLAADGFFVVGTATTAEGAARISDALGEHGMGAVLALQDVDSAQDLIKTITVQAEAPQVLVNNAGITRDNLLLRMNEDEWTQVVDTNLHGLFRVTKAVLRGMLKARWGRIVNMGSIHSVRASPFKVGYISAKHGLLGLTRTAAREGGAFGITVNAVLPSYVRTPLVENQITDQASIHGISEDEVVETIMLTQTSVKRLVEPDEVAGLVNYLCSNEAAAVTGAAWNIDAGTMAG